MIEVAIKAVISIVLTGLFLGSLFYIWTGDLDVKQTLTKPLSNFVSLKKKSKLDIDVKQISVARYSAIGSSENNNFAFIFYVLHFVNVLDQSVTLKSVHLRLEGKPDIKSSVVQTGVVETAKGEKIELLLLRASDSNVILMNWKNLRQVIGEYKTLAPGGVLTGSAVFVLPFSTTAEVDAIKKIKLVAVDFSGNEAVKELDIDPSWKQNMEFRSIPSTSFEIDPNGQWK